MLPYIGNIISGMGLAWAIYTFTTKRREETAEKDRKDFLKTYQYTTSLLEKEINDIKAKLEGHQKELSTLRLAVVSSHEKIKMHNQLLVDNYTRIEKILDRHEQKLDSYGKVIVK